MRSLLPLLLLLAVAAAHRGNRGFNRFGPGNRWEASPYGKNDDTEMGEASRADFGRRHHGGRHRRPHGPPPPPFLKEVSGAARREFYKIIHSVDSTKAEIKEKIGKWADENGVGETVKAYYTRLGEHRKEMRDRMQKAIQRLPAMFKLAAETLDDDSLTVKETWQKMRASAAADPPTAAALRGVFHALAHPRYNNPFLPTAFGNTLRHAGKAYVLKKQKAVEEEEEEEEEETLPARQFETVSAEVQSAVPRLRPPMHRPLIGRGVAVEEDEMPDF